MPSRRPSPEAMLALAQAEARSQGRGRLKLFFGAAPGVGKTFTMLEEASARQAAGVDVLIGWLETHGRPQTAARAEGLPRLPPRAVPYRDTVLHELDLDGALAARPGLLLVDELPHTNAPGSRHTWRWQDVEELLQAGIDVYSTLNVQHLESLADVVERVSGVTVRERVPDRILDEADELELVDLPLEELLDRLDAGQIYEAEVAGRAREGFFKKSNLLALRELALRRTAERVDRDVEAARLAGGGEVWPTRERVLVAVGPAPQSADLVRATFRMASRLRAPWIAVSVEPASHDWSTEDTARVNATLALAERLGASTRVVRDDRVADALLEAAARLNATRIVVGRPTHPPWRDRLRGSMLDRLMRGARGLDVLVVGTEDGDQQVLRLLDGRPRVPAREYAEALGVVALFAAIGLLTRGILDVTDNAMLHLLAVVLASRRVSRRPAVLAALAAVASFDLLFVPPYYTFRVSDMRFLTSFLVMGAVGLTVSALTLRVRASAEAAETRERRTRSLYEITRAFATTTEPPAIGQALAQHAAALTGAQVAVWLAGPTLRAVAGEGGPLDGEAREQAVARWALEHGMPAGVGTDTLPQVAGLYLPIRGSGGVSGVLGLALKGPLDPEQRQLIDLFANQAGLALDRALLAEAAANAALNAETERTRSSLLSAVSHDLRTPLASIVGGASAILSRELLPPAERALMETLRDEADRLGLLVNGLLELTRLESGAVQPRVEWWPASELSHAVLSRMAGTLADRPVRSTVEPPQLELPCDGLLMGQVLENLIGNAHKFAPPGTPIEVAWLGRPGQAQLRVLDRGPGVPEGEEQKIFERFYRAPDSGRRVGAGLGLAICAAAVRLHGGSIRVERRADGPGACFVVELPVAGVAPAFTEEVS